MFHRTPEGQTVIGGLIGAVVGRMLPVKRKNRGLATLASAGVGAFVLRDQIAQLLDRVGLFGLLDQVLGGFGGQTATQPPSTSPPSGGGGGAVVL